MKKFLFSFLFLSFLFLMACNTSRNTTASNGQERGQMELNEDQLTDRNWSNLLRQVPGLQIRGAEPDITLTLRGARSLRGDSSPLIVLDGVILGRNFGDLARAILPKDVESIRVLNTSQAARYGTRGGNGVIEVKQKE